MDHSERVTAVAGLLGPTPTAAKTGQNQQEHPKLVATNNETAAAAEKAKSN